MHPSFLQVSWFLDGHRLTPDSRHLIEEHDTLAVLRLRDIGVRDLGNYSCQAENSQGRARDHVELSGEEKSQTEMGNCLSFLPMEQLIVYSI